MPGFRAMCLFFGSDRFEVGVCCWIPFLTLDITVLALGSVSGLFRSRTGPRLASLSLVLHSLLLYRHKLLASAKNTPLTVHFRRLLRRRTPSLPLPPSLCRPSTPAVPSPARRPCAAAHPRDAPDTDAALREAPPPPDPAHTLRASLRSSVSFAILLFSRPITRWP